MSNIPYSDSKLETALADLIEEQLPELIEEDNWRAYSSFELKKASGGRRHIAVPRPGLKAFQRRFADTLDTVYEPHEAVHGYVIGRSIISNARQHVGRRFVLNVDFQDFFPSISEDRIEEALRKQPFRFGKCEARVFSRLCSFQGVLPQGAPSSPILSNIVCSELDAALADLARTQDCTYTRYCDDITFSTCRKVFPHALAEVTRTRGWRSINAGEALTRIVQAHGFMINPKKSRLLRRSDRQEVTGLTVNDFVNVPKPYMRSLEAALHSWERLGIAEACYRCAISDPAHFRSSLFGKIQYVGTVRGFDDARYQSLAHAFQQLNQLYG